MDLLELAKSGAQVSVTVTAKDLNDFAKSLLDEAIKQAKITTDLEENNKLFTRDEVKSILHASDFALWDWEKKGLLVPVRAGRKVLFTKREMDRFLKTQRRPL